MPLNNNARHVVRSGFFRVDVLFSTRHRVLTLQNNMYAPHFSADGNRPVETTYTIHMYCIACRKLIDKKLNATVISRSHVYIYEYVYLYTRFENRDGFGSKLLRLTLPFCNNIIYFIYQYSYILCIRTFAKNYNFTFRATNNIRVILLRDGEHLTKAYYYRTFHCGRVVVFIKKYSSVYINR